MAANAIFVVDPVGWNQAFRSWSGIVGRDMTRRTMKGTALALGTVPKPGSPPRNRTGINYSTGRLAATIHPEWSRWGVELEGQVVAGTKHAPFVHEGTRRHRIPRTGERLMVFYWGPPNGPGRVVFRTHVNHPGTMPNRFLSEHLRSMVT